MNASELVLFIHSTGTGPSLWASVPDAAIGGRRRVAPPNLGYAPAEPVPRGRIVTAQDDAAHVVRAVPRDAERVHVVAHSYGCLVALHALGLLGPRLASLFLYEPVIFGGDSVGNEWPTIANAPELVDRTWIMTDEERGGREEWLEIFIDYWNRPGSWSHMLPAMRESCIAAGWKMFQEVHAVYMERTPFDAWQLPMPTTVGVGTLTTPAARAMAHGLAKDRANVTLVEVPDASHMAPLMTPRRVHEQIARHFARLEGT
jgi:pimeloyl-ACP methyl ester carboxylesterase